MPALERIIAIGLALLDKAFESFGTVTAATANCSAYTYVNLSDCGVTLASNLETLIAGGANLGKVVFAALGAVNI